MIQHKLDLVNLSNHAKINTLVENRTAYTLERCELNVFETYAPSVMVPLTFNNFVITSMLRGKKVMHLQHKEVFDYLPGQTVIVPSNETMQIDFPDASEENPTQCIALAIDNEQIKKTINYLNEFFPKSDKNDFWSLNYNEYHFYNNEDIAYLINKIIRICSQNSVEKDILADLTLKELLVRIMQVQNLMATNDYSNPQNALSFVVSFIKSNLNQKININLLTEKACMSKASFYRLFKRELGVSPNDYILTEKINRAKELLRKPNSKVSAVGYELGFTDANYFIRAFKKLVGTTPGSYQLKFANTLLV
jgi:AraC-like DNA-binding protein